MRVRKKKNEAMRMNIIQDRMPTNTNKMSGMRGQSVLMSGRSLWRQFKVTSGQQMQEKSEKTKTGKHILGKKGGTGT